MWLRRYRLWNGTLTRRIGRGSNTQRPQGFRLVEVTLLGAIIGDIVGSIYEFNNRRSKEFPFFGPDADFTDDTVCTIAVADALLHGIDPAEALHDWCGRYPGRGYGGMFRRWLETGDRRPYGSYGNGAAMRVSPAGLLARSLDEALSMARKVTEVTHDHPEGLKGAAATAHAIFLARAGDVIRENPRCDPVRIRLRPGADGRRHSAELPLQRDLPGDSAGSIGVRTRGKRF